MTHNSVMWQHMWYSEAFSAPYLTPFHFSGAVPSPGWWMNGSPPWRSQSHCGACLWAAASDWLSRCHCSSGLPGCQPADIPEPPSRSREHPDPSGCSSHKELLAGKSGLHQSGSSIQCKNMKWFPVYQLSWISLTLSSSSFDCPHSRGLFLSPLLLPVFVHLFSLPLEIPAGLTAVNTSVIPPFLLWLGGNHWSLELLPPLQMIGPLHRVRVRTSTDRRVRLCGYKLLLYVYMLSYMSYMHDTDDWEDSCVCEPAVALISDTHRE